MNRRLLIGLLAGVLVSGATAYGHHSFAATYVTDKEITIEGDMIQFMFRNPHSFVHLMGPDETGQMQRWAIEWAAAGQLTGITRDTLKPGDHVIITGNPGRNATDNRVRLLTFKRPKDGWSWGILEAERFD